MISRSNFGNLRGNTDAIQRLTESPATESPAQPRIADTHRYHILFPCFLHLN